MRPADRSASFISSYKTKYTQSQNQIHFRDSESFAYKILLLSISWVTENPSKKATKQCTKVGDKQRTTPLQQHRHSLDGLGYSPSTKKLQHSEQQQTGKIFSSLSCLPTCICTKDSSFVSSISFSAIRRLGTFFRLPSFPGGTFKVLKNLSTLYYRKRKAWLVWSSLQNKKKTD